MSTLYGDGSGIVTELGDEVSLLPRCAYTDEKGIRCTKYKMKDSKYCCKHATLLNGEKIPVLQDTN